MLWLSKLKTLGLLLVFVLLISCGAETEPAADSSGTAARDAKVADDVIDHSSTDSNATAAQDESQAVATRAAVEATTVIFLGDSLTAGFGLDAEQAFPYLIERQLTAEGLALRMVNAGVSGDTTAGGLRRLDWLLKQQPNIVVVALGGNDGLRGLELSASEENLRQIIIRAQQSGAQVLLAGMQIPPNYGLEYIEAFRDIYPRLAAELKVPLIPFLLAEVGGDPELNQADGIHPTAAGQEIVARTVLEYLRPLLL